MGYITVSVEFRHLTIFLLHHAEAQDAGQRHGENIQRINLIKLIRGQERKPLDILKALNILCSHAGLGKFLLVEETLLLCPFELLLQALQLQGLHAFPIQLFYLLIRVHDLAPILYWYC